jgi:hypothetical protein
MELAPICLFTYNRLDETKQTVVALQANFLAPQSELYVFSDGPKQEALNHKVQAVRDYLKTINGFKKITILESDTNKGLANSIITGVSQILETYSCVIVLEDDLVTTPNFLDFMNQALVFFELTPSIYSINGYSLEQKGIKLDSYYIHFRSFPWGWATWKNRWNLNYFDKKKINQIIQSSPELLYNFKSDNGNDVVKMLKKTLKGEISSWYIRWVFNNYISEKKSLFPAISKVKNIGYSNQATHYSGGISAYKTIMDKSFSRKFDFRKTIDITKDDQDFLIFFTKRYKIYYRLKLMTKISGIKLIINEITQKLFR